ncbi:MAG: adenylate kinase [Lentisphaeria bacterium]|nr:adenylate kinase [Lentisphaeria bacterium]
MRKIVILGCPGSGKSTFAVKLQTLTGLPLHHLDRIWWKPDRSHISRPEFDAALQKIMAEPGWILDGDYSRTYEVRLAACDTVFFLDYGESVCLAGIRDRVGNVRDDMPWTDRELDPALEAEVRRYRAENRPAVLELLKRYDRKTIHIFHTRAETDEWLAGAGLTKAE